MEIAPMIAFRKSARSRDGDSTWREAFVEMLHTIRRYAEAAFCGLDEEAREEAVQEAVCNALVAYERLDRQGKADVASPSALARFAVAQVRDGRKVGTRQNSRDVMSQTAQQRHGFGVQRLDRYDWVDQEWTEAVVEDCRTPVPDQAAFRIDFPAWLATRSRRDCQVALKLGVGYSGEEVAKQFQLSPGRISQLRRQFHESWLAFHGETEDG